MELAEEKRIEGLRLQGQALWTYCLLRPHGIWWMINSEHCGAFVSIILIRNETTFTILYF